MPVCLLWRNVYLDLLSIFFKEIILFIYFWLRWLFVAVWAFSSCSEWGLLSSCSAQVSYCVCLPIVVLFLIVVSSLVAEHGL